MEQYESLRHFADSWGLLFLTVFFVGVVLYTLRPGSRPTHDDIADIPFRHDDRPAEKETEGDRHG